MAAAPNLNELLDQWLLRESLGEALTATDLIGEPDKAVELDRMYKAVRAVDRIAYAVNSLIGDTAVPGGMNSMLETLAPADLPSLPGYQLLSVLGQGGMGVVYEARHLRLDRHVALKVIRAERSTPDLCDRFQTEARAVARLNHPHIVQVYEVGEYQPTPAARAVPYLALEFVSGGSLEKRLDDKPMPPKEAARLVRILARAMHHVHERDLIHRDLKPDNILLAPPGDEAGMNTSMGCPKITDFGLARVSQGEGGTVPGMLMGTPAYMSPEQADGKQVGPPTDIHALGAILYRVLTGRPPFQSDSLSRLLYLVAQEAPKPPRALDASIPPQLEAICLRCLAKDPDDRPTASALAAELDRFLGGTLTPTEITPRPRLTPRVSRRGFLAGAAALVVAGALGVGYWATRPKPDPVIEPPPPLPPLKGSIDVMMSRPGDSIRQGIGLHDPGTRPLKKGDEVRVLVDLNRPAYVYVLWIDTNGEVQPVYPWLGGKWDKRGPEKTTAKLRLPDQAGVWNMWKIDPGPPGLETLFMLCLEKPLPEDIDLQMILKDLGPQKTTGVDAGAVAWFENGNVVRDEPNRAASLGKVVEGSNPVERINRQLQGRVSRHVNGYTRSVTFGNLGGPEKE